MGPFFIKLHQTQLFIYLLCLFYSSTPFIRMLSVFICRLLPLQRRSSLTAPWPSTCLQSRHNLNCLFSASRNFSSEMWPLCSRIEHISEQKVGANHRNKFRHWKWAQWDERKSLFLKKKMGWITDLSSDVLCLFCSRLNYSFRNFLIQKLFKSAKWMIQNETNLSLFILMFAF